MYFSIFFCLWVNLLSSLTSQKSEKVRELSKNKATTIMKPQPQKSFTKNMKIKKYKNLNEIKFLQRSMQTEVQPNVPNVESVQNKLLASVLKHESRFKTSRV